MVMSWQGSSSNHEVKNNFGVCTVDKVSKMKREERDKYIIQGIQTINKMVSIFFFYHFGLGNKLIDECLRKKVMTEIIMSSRGMNYNFFIYFSFFKELFW